MNLQNVRTDVNLSNAEMEVMGRSGPSLTKKTAAVDPLEVYTKELNELAAELGFDFLEGGGDAADKAADKGRGSSDDTPRRAAVAPVRTPARQPSRNPIGNKSIDALLGDLNLGSDSASSGSDDSDSGDSDDSDDSGSSGSDDSGSDGSDDSGSSSGDAGGGSSGDAGSGDSGSDDSDGTSDDEILAKLEKDLGIDLDATRRRSRRRQRVHEFPVSADTGRRSRTTLTEEQERRGHINAVMGDMRHETRTSFGVEYERIQDVKATKLEQIDQLRMTLVEEGIDCKSVGTPTKDSPVEEIDSVLAILKLKNDRNRYSTLAEEVILGVAEGIETVFDGTREVPIVGWKPDYTGYHNTVNVKLHRMRFETSQVVGEIIEKYNIGPKSRIAMELLPSFFLYPRQQKKQRGAPGLHAELGGGERGGQVARAVDARSAYSAIRRSDVPDSVASLAAI